MGKGFGVKPEVQLGYVLLVLPDANAYAAKLDLDIGQVHIENPLMAIVLGLFRFVCFLFNLLTFQKFHRPNADALANINESNKEEFIGLTSLLEDAQVWKSIKEAKQAIAHYNDFLLEQINENKRPQTVIIKRLKQSSDGRLIAETVNTFIVTG